MPTLDSDSLKSTPFHGEQGNGSLWRGFYNKAGVLNGDIIRLAKIPAGALVADMDLVFEDTGTGVTGKLGYEPIDSADGPTADDDYWFAAGQDLATAAGRIRSASFPIRFDFGVYVILTVAGANFTGAPKVEAIAKGEYQGVK